MEGELTEIVIVCKSCGKEAKKQLPEEMVEYLRMNDFIPTGHCTACIKRGDAGELKQLMYQMGFYKKQR